MRHAQGRGVVFAWSRGPILVTAGQGLTYIIQEILAVVHAEPSQHVGAFADTTGKLARMFSVYIEDAGVSLRGTFVINPEGTLMNSEVNALNMGRNIDELMRKFKANIYLTRKPKEACPAKWNNDGDATLTPSAKMVGKVHEALRS